MMMQHNLCSFAEGGRIDDLPLPHLVAGACHSCFDTVCGVGHTGKQKLWGLGRHADTIIDLPHVYAVGAD